MLKRISAFILALTMLCVTACSENNSSDTTKADSSSSVSEQATDSSSDDSSEDSEASSQTETTTTASETTTSETTTETKASEDSSASDTTTTKATADATTTTQATANTTTKASAGSKTTTKATTTTTKPTTTTKKTTTTTKATQPAVQKSALDLAYEAMVKCNTPTQAQLNLITNDLNNYVKSKGFCVKSVLDTSFYPFEKNGKPTFDIDGSTNFGNCDYLEGFANDRAASAYYEGSKTLEQAREFYKKELKAHIDFMINTINDRFQNEKKMVAKITQ